jgi:predicted RNase H-like nuclease
MTAAAVSARSGVLLVVIVHHLREPRPGPFADACTEQSMTATALFAVHWEVMDDHSDGLSAAREFAVTGMDGCAGGWIAVTLAFAALPAVSHEPASPLPGNQPDLARAPAGASVAVAATLDELPFAAVTGIDMPLGLLNAGWREADILARRALGRRGVTVFAIPPRPVWECQTYAEANRLCRDLAGKGLAAQAWGLRRKIIEADACRRRAPSSLPPVRLYEVHPELSFAALAGAPLGDSKHTRAGLAIRRELLARAGISLPPKVAGAGENDLLDAAAVAWSARRIAAGQAAVLTSPAQRADDGGEIAIRY